jgi:hypothetical protein
LANNEALLQLTFKSTDPILIIAYLKEVKNKEMGIRRKTHGKDRDGIQHSC